MNLVGQEFGDWKVIEQLPSRKGKTYWNCQCKYCGKTKAIQGSNLRNNLAANCCTIKNNNISQMNEIRICPLCGKEFKIIRNGWTRKFCFECSPTYNKNDPHAREKSMTSLRKSIKKYLISYKGNKCCRCGYNICAEALHFHHLDPSQKDFELSDHTAMKGCNLDTLKQEADKCILLCANCHSELHAGYWNIEDIDLS